VELIGRGKSAAVPLISKLRVLPCLWYRWKVEEHNGENKWRTLDKGESSDYFMLLDDSGVCVVDPEYAEILTKHKDEWTSGGYRYTEWKLIQDDYLYVIGEFKTVGGGSTALTREELVKQILSEWKMDNADLLRRFDLDNNGVLDMQEWMLARQAAKREADKRLDQARSEPDTSFMLKPHDGRLFLISNIDQDKLALRYQLWAWAHVGIFFGALGSLSWLVQLPEF
jgi:hypothetical protein